MGNTERQIILGEESPTSGTVLPTSGVTYFKLKDKIYEGDDTKNCGLVGAEMDNNFFVLRGLDIKSMEMSGGTLTLTKFNNDVFSANMENTLFEFDKEKGALTITYPNGEKEVLEGFVGNADSKYDDLVLATDGTIKGNGISINPLRLSEIEKTGTYSPVDSVVDELPEMGTHKGQRFIVKEKLSNYGQLYPYNGVELINNALEEINSEWRVPSKADWDSLLNYFECEEKKNHGDGMGWLGEKAGIALKSELLWKESSDETKGMNVAGFNILPLGYAASRNQFIEADDGDAEGAEMIAAFWATGSTEPDNACAKIFAFDHGDVQNTNLVKKAKCSLRLCKDYSKDNFSEVEDILTLSYPCVLIDDKIWTSINVGESNSIYSGITSEEWEKLITYIEVSPQPNYYSEEPEKCDDVSMYYKKDENGAFVKCAADEKADGKTTYYIPYIQEQEEQYFLAEWDGSMWLKKTMKIGESVAIGSHEDKVYHEWRLFADGLKDTVNTTMDSITKELILEREERIAEDKELDAKIQEHSELLGSKAVVLTNKMTSAQVTDAVKQYWEDENKTILLYGMNNTNGQKRYIPLTVYGTVSKWRLIGIYSSSMIPSDSTERNSEQLWKISYDNQTNAWTYVCNSDVKYVQQKLTSAQQRQACTNINAIENKGEVITTTHLASQAVASAKIKDKTIGASKLGDDAVVERVIKDGNVTTSKIADRAITSDKIMAGVHLEYPIVDAIQFTDKSTGERYSIKGKYEDETDVFLFQPSNGDYAVLRGIAEPRNEYDAANKKYVDDAITAEENARNTAINDAITTEKDERATVDDALSSALNQEIADRKAAITAEENARNTAINDAITTEKDERATADSTLNTNLAVLSGQVVNFSSATNNAITTLNGDYSLQGSVKYTADSVLRDALYADGVKEIDESAIEHSLARKVKGSSSPTKYYIYPYADGMYISGTQTTIQDYIKALENRIAALENELVKASELTAKVQNIVKGYVSGTDSEISVVEDSGKLKIGFASDAKFESNA